jgi:hypothetical protein
MYKSGSDTSCTHTPVGLQRRREPSKSEGYQGRKVMAQNDSIYDMDDFEDAQGSDLVKKLRAKIDEMSKFAKELEKENTTLKAGERKRSVASVLESKGYNPKIAAFIPSDLDPTEENLVDWLNEYGDVFGGPVQGQAEQATAPDNSSIQAVQRMNAAEASGRQTADSDLMSRIDAAGSEEELLAVLKGL